MSRYVFDPFRRTAGAVATHAQGVGLGLYIVKQFVELLRGTIQVESALGAGTTFTVRVPRQLRRQSESARRSLAPLEGAAPAALSTNTDDHDARKAAATRRAPSGPSCGGTGASAGCCRRAR